MNCAVRDRSKTIEAKLFIHGLWLLSQSGLKANSRYNQMDSLHVYTVFVFTRKRQFGEHRIGVFWPMKSLKLICANPHFPLGLGVFNQLLDCGAMLLVMFIGVANHPIDAWASFWIVSIARLHEFFKRNLRQIGQYLGMDAFGIG